MQKDLNEVVLTGLLKPRVSEDRKIVGGRICTAPSEEQGTGQQATSWHTLVAVTEEAKQSIRAWVPAGAMACVKGRFRRREYQVDGQTRYANEILLFDPVATPANTARQSTIRIEGHLGTKPDIRYTAKGLAVITLSVATNHSRKDRHAPTGWVKETIWHRALLFGDEARKKVAALTKGSRVSLSGELTYRSRQKSGDGVVAEILVKQLSVPGRQINASTQEGREPRAVANEPLPVEQAALLTTTKAPLTYAVGEQF